MDAQNLNLKKRRVKRMARMNEPILKSLARKVYPNGLKIGEAKKEAKNR